MGNFCNPHNFEDAISILMDVATHGSARAAARYYGTSEGNGIRWAAKARAIVNENEDNQHIARDLLPSHFIKGVSTYYNKDNIRTGQWVKTDTDKETLYERLKAAVEGLISEIPKQEPIKHKGESLTDLLSLYVITDYHLGLLAWQGEGGDTWNEDIAEQVILAWFKEAMDKNPDSEVGYFAQLGDLLHIDGLVPVTPAHRNVVDTNMRYTQIVRQAIRVVRAIINMLLKKHKKVVILMAEGNHDPAGSVWLREMLAEFYGDEERLEIDQTEIPYYCYEHGDTSLFFHHGHLTPPQNIHNVMVEFYRAEIGRTKFSYCHMGDKHHMKKFGDEYNVMYVEQHSTLTAKSSYDTRCGFSSNRAAKSIVYDKLDGLKDEFTIRPRLMI